MWKEGPGALYEPVLQTLCTASPISDDQCRQWRCWKMTCVVKLWLHYSTFSPQTSLLGSAHTATWAGSLLLAWCQLSPGALLERLSKSPSVHHIVKFEKCYLKHTSVASFWSVPGSTSMSSVGAHVRFLAPGNMTLEFPCLVAPWELFPWLFLVGFWYRCDDT